MNKMTVGAKKGGYSWAQEHRFILTKADITNVLNAQTDSNRDNTEPSYGTSFQSDSLSSVCRSTTVTLSWKQRSTICN